MPEVAKSWGLSIAERRTVMGIRAAGLLLLGLGIPVLGIPIQLLSMSGWLPTAAGDDGSWSISRLLDMLRSRALLITFVSSIGPYLMAIVAGVYLMRCDPRPLLRKTGANV